MAYCLVCERERAEQGPRQNQTYVNVAARRQQIGNQNETLAEYQARAPSAEWFDPGNNEFLIEILKTLYDDIGSDAFPLFHDGFRNLPYWQQQEESAFSGGVLTLGSYEDPTDSTSTFTEGTSLPDDRFILRVYDKDPVNDNTAVNLAEEEFQEAGEGDAKSVERFLRLFRDDGSPVNRNVANDRIFVDGYWLDLDWGSSDNLGAGVARVFMSIGFTGQGHFRSDAGYRVLGPNDEDCYQWTVYTKTLQLLGQ